MRASAGQAVECRCVPVNDRGFPPFDDEVIGITTPAGALGAGE
ncbi:hypothetical protein [Acrocarpospora corrugata]|nr:hypothetical protein [Acrocarpospora corrugata]